MQLLNLTVSMARKWIQEDPIYQDAYTITSLTSQTAGASTPTFKHVSMLLVKVLDDI